MDGRSHSWQKYRYGPRTLRVLHYLRHTDWIVTQIASKVKVSRQRVNEINKQILPRHLQ